MAVSSVRGDAAILELCANSCLLLRRAPITIYVYAQFGQDLLANLVRIVADSA